MSQEDAANSGTTTKVAVALLLTFAAGYVDVVGYLGLYQVFTANMTGNTVHFAINLLHSHWRDAVVAGSMIPIFVTGSIVGRPIIEVGARNRIRRIASLTLSIEPCSSDSRVLLLRTQALLTLKLDVLPPWHLLRESKPLLLPGLGR